MMASLLHYTGSINFIKGHINHVLLLIQCHAVLFLRLVPLWLKTGYKKVYERRGTNLVSSIKNSSIALLKNLKVL